MMERMKLLAFVVALGVAAVSAGAQEKKGEKAAAAAAGPYELPAFDAVKDKCKLSAEQAPKVEAAYKEGATKEEETKKRAKENQTDRKDLEKFLAMGKIDLINKVKDILDDGQKKTYDGLVAASVPDKKKKK